ncbi:MAG: hypothetical protein HFF42_00615 [Lawsonibacter sp.]|jgi:hypothetical protein|nr:hypothetical protein [Lawsonibacter sp.]
MIYPKRQLILTFAAVVLAGCALHFLYGWQPNAATALFSPVNESLWEHVKLVFWPYLGAAFLLNRGRPGGIRPWLLVLPLLCVLTLALGWVYHITLGGEAMWVDIAIYILVIALGFWLPTRFSGPFKGVKWLLPIAAAVLLALLIGWFTLYPPKGLLFRDLAAVGSWLPLPC